METISYKVEFPDPYENAYERVIMEFEHRLRSREMEGIEAALKEHGYVKEHTCKLGEPSTYYPVHLMTCSYCGEETQEANYCSKCGAKAVV